MQVRRRLRRSLALAVLPPLAACDFGGPQSVLDPQGPIAQAQQDLFLWTYYLSWPVMILVVAVIAYSMWKFRAKSVEDAKALPHQTHGHTTLEIAWTLIPVVLVILVAVPTVRTLFATESTIAASQYTDDDVVIRATGYQWWFKFDYGDGVVTSSEMHIPVGRRVIVELDAADVLHSFWVPNLAGKRDMIPNQANQVWFSADRPGVFYGQCAELCLGAHAYMRFRVIASEEEDYQAWLASFRDAGATVQTVQADPQIERGRQLVAQKGCIACHTIDGYYADGTPVGGSEFPNLTNFGLRLTVATSMLDATPENVARWIRYPDAVKPGNRMPTLWTGDDPNAEEEVAAITAYLLSLGRDSGAATATLGETHGNR
ncbi:cytochrome c oxidase subunit II [soil metagenome]